MDFTILAATSVLTDMVDKCPPAEACRDAFDRMSKATVAMCMSTTAFSSNAAGSVGNSGGLNSRRRVRQPQQPPQQLQVVGQQPAEQIAGFLRDGSRSIATENDAEYFRELELQRQQQQMRNGFAVSNARSQPLQQKRRPPQHQQSQSQQVKGLPRPQFDMSLDDLYAPSPVLINRSVLSNKRNSLGGQIKAEDSPVAFSIPRSEDPTPNPAQQAARQSQQPQVQYGLSPPTTNFNSGPSSMSDQSPIGQQQYMTSPTSLTPTNLAINNNYLPQTFQQQLNPNMEVDFSNLPEFSNLDFLNDPSLNFNTMNGGDVAMRMDGGVGNGGVPAGAGGVNLGFGWGAEGDGHDFSEGGNQLDFFDGFYFGTGV